MDDILMDSEMVDEMMEDKSGNSKQISESKRVSRNMNEKKRRDRFNVLIGELAAIISPTSRKIDKTTVLKKAIACLKSQKDISPASCSKPREGWQPPFVSDPELCQLIVESMEGFVINVDADGIITFISENVTSQLGYLPAKVINTQVGDYLDVLDMETISTRLQNLKLHEREMSSYRTPEKNSSASAISELVELDLKFKYGPLSEMSGFASLHCISQAYIVHNSSHVSTGKGGTATNRTAQLVLLCCLETLCPVKVLSLSNTSSTEFTARLTLNWKFTHVDQRALVVIGYLPSELIDSSLYQYIHVEDLANLSRYHKTLVYKGRVTTCYYRFLTKGQMWIWLRSCCYISYNQWNSRPEYIIATTSTVSQSEVTTNQINILKQDEINFKNLEKKKALFPSSVATPISAPSCSTDSLAAYTESAVPNYPALSSSFGITVPVIEHSARPTRISSAPILTADGEEPASPVMERGNANKINRMMSSGASVSQVLDSMLQNDASDAGFGSDEESVSDKNSESVSPWNLPLPKGLSATQYKLHEQLKDKHVLLENSIKRQIRELNKIKKQIETNKDLWDFNKKVQKFRGPGLNGTMERNKNVPTRTEGENLSLDLNNLNLLPQDKQLRTFMESLPTVPPVDYPLETSSAPSSQLSKDCFPVPVPNSSLAYNNMPEESSYSQSCHTSSRLTSNSVIQFQSNASNQYPHMPTIRYSTNSSAQYGSPVATPSSSSYVPVQYPFFPFDPQSSS